MPIRRIAAKRNIVKPQITQGKCLSPVNPALSKMAGVRFFSPEIHPGNSKTHNITHISPSENCVGERNYVST